MLELEHSKQLECLQDTYRDQLLTHCTYFSNMASDEESFRQRYQAEIEQLRTFCEKGLSAMESSHRRIVADLEDKHREEIERLLLEKETALAEETQATLAALDAMRKAHQSEVQREVARFKQEFLKQFQKGDHSAYTAKANEEELEELRREILSFSEKFSIKCVENASLEEKLRSTTQILKQLQQMQHNAYSPKQQSLLNKQFRAHLASDDPAKDTKFVQGLSSPKDANDDINACEDSEPKLHANFQEDQLDHKDMVAVQSNTLNSSVKSSELSVELMRSSVDIPPSATTCSHIQLACNNTNSTVPVEAIQMVISQKNDDAINKIDVEKNALNYTNCIDNSNQSVNDVKIRHGDNIDVNVQLEDDDDDELNASLYTYEPCYKQASNLYSFQNRLNSQGLNSSTFGKKLKLATRKTTTPATSFKVGYKSAATRPIFATASFATAITKAASPSPASFVYKATQNTPIAASDQIEANHNSQQLLSPIAATKATNIATADIAERTLSNSHNMERLASQSSELSQLSDLQQLAAKLTATSITQPVEQPKISSANSNLINRNRLSYNDSSMHKINKSTTLNLDTNENKAANRISTTENQDIIYSADYDSRHSLHVDEWSKISSSNNNIRIAERSAINLTSFNDFLRKTRDVPMPKIYAKISAKHRPSNTNTISTTTIVEEPIIVTKSKASKPRRAKATTNKSVKSSKKVKPTKSENFEIMVDAGDVSEKEDNRPDVGDAWWQRPRDYSDVLSISSSSTTYLTNTNLDAKQSISDEEDMVSLNGPPPKCSPTSYRRGSDVEQTRSDLRRQRQRAIPPASKRTAARAATASKHLRRFELEI